IEGTTDGSGKVTFEVSVHVREAEIVLLDKGLRFPIQIGDMDPVNETSGVRKRLANLGFYTPPWKGTSEEALKTDLTAFQKAYGLPPTGEVDDATRQRLVEAHGS